ncbi:MAG: hypothetical protein KJO11_16120 [Gemmatimonadetes bacterium]|nr:hypothetical protein [Gemmatimonadota bacterium]MBT8402333.1 hypothetical protein [Gemmatimonadota bacterium]NNK63040.1 hypothetical protein [Gemmatimonadota bacterium]
MIDNLLKRLRGALGFGAVGAVAFHLTGWLIIGGESLYSGIWPSATLIARMSVFTLSVGGFVGLLTAGAITVGAYCGRSITQGRAFLLGLPFGAVGGLALGLTAGGLPVSPLLVHAAAFGFGTGVLAATAVAIAETVDDGPLLERARPLEELPG